VQIEIDETRNVLYTRSENSTIQVWFMKKKKFNWNNYWNNDFFIFIRYSIWVLMD
jgi:hypothetical protein